MNNVGSAFGLLAEGHGQSLAQMTLVTGMMKRDGSAHILHERVRSRGELVGIAGTVAVAVECRVRGIGGVESVQLFPRVRQPVAIAGRETEAP